MTLQPYSQPLVFSGYHGDNIVLSNNGLVSEGQYLTAHGQFITQGPLEHNQQFGLEFRGAGIVKFNIFKFRRKAVKWVLSKQPLRKGCKRLKMKGLAHYNVIASETDNCVRVESQLRIKTEPFIFDMGPEATLAFDIECGDVVVSIVNTTSHVTFDTYYRSPHIEITTWPRMCSARLLHYNPSALCFLDNTSLKPGTIFELEVRHSGQSNDSGSYIRVCVSQLRSPYVNDEPSPCGASATLPAFSGKRMCLVGGDSEVLQVTVVPDGLFLDRGNKEGAEKFICPITAEFTLWFELHKVSLRAWQLLDYNIPNVKDELTAYTPTNQTFLPRQPPLPPPPNVKDELTAYTPTNQTFLPRQPPLPPPVCCRRTRKDPTLTHAGYTEDVRGEAGLSDNMSAVREMNMPVFTNNYASYVSPDSVCNYCEGAAHPRYTLHTRTDDILQCDLLSDLHIDPIVLNSIQSNLVTMSSLESYTDSRTGDLDSLQPVNSSSAGKETIYERPDRIWLHGKPLPGQLASDVIVNNNHLANVSDHKITKRHLAVLSQTSHTTAITPPKPEPSSQRRMQNRHYGCPASGDDLKVSNYVLKLSATAFLQSYRDDSTHEVYNRRLDVHRGCRTVQIQESRHETPASLHTFQGKQSPQGHAFHSEQIHRYDSPGSIRADNTGLDNATHKNKVPVSIPTDNSAASNNSDASTVNSQDNIRRLVPDKTVRDKTVRDKTKCQQMSNSFRRRCIYMPKKPDLPPRAIAANCFPEATMGNRSSHVMEPHAKTAVVPVTSKERMNMDMINFHKCNTTTSGKDAMYNYLASLTLCASPGKGRSVSNVSDQAKKTVIKRNTSLRFLGQHCKGQTPRDNVLTRPLSPKRPQ